MITDVMTEKQIPARVAEDAEQAALGARQVAFDSGRKALLSGSPQAHREAADQHRVASENHRVAAQRWRKVLPVTTDNITRAAKLETQSNHHDALAEFHDSQAAPEREIMAAARAMHASRSDVYPTVVSALEAYLATVEGNIAYGRCRDARLSRPNKMRQINITEAEEIVSTARAIQAARPETFGTMAKAMDAYLTSGEGNAAYMRYRERLGRKQR